jgi:hypothetical protein
VSTNNGPVVGPECSDCGHNILEGDEVTKEIPGQIFVNKDTGFLEFGQTEETKLRHYECPELEGE